jgi:mono/diheme cytochrome c family protein
MKLKILIITLFMCTNIYASIQKGKEVYLINCASCHSVTMQGSFGKDFNLVSYTRTKQEIIDYAQNPAMNFKKFGYSANAMPTLPLTQDELEDVAQYIDSLQPFKKWMIKK